MVIEQKQKGGFWYSVRPWKAVKDINVKEEIKGHNRRK